MKRFNFLSKSSSQSCGHSSVTLASTVGSPSAHRRGAMLKLISVLVLVLTFGVGQMWGSKWTYSFTDTQSTGNKTWSNVAWTLAMDGGTTSTYSSTQGAHYGTNNSTCNSVTLSTSGISGTITSIEIDASRGSSLVGTLSVKVNNTAYTLSSGNAALTTSNATNVFTGDKSGNIEIKWTKTSGKGAFYIKAITIKYCVPPTALTNGTITSNTAHLSWTDSQNTNKYEVYVSTSSDTPAANATPSVTVTNKYVDITSGLTASITYNWWVRAYDQTNSSKSAWVKGTNFTTEAGASCTNEITISKGMPSNGSFTMTPNGGTVCIDEGNASVTISNINPSNGYRFKEITSSGGGTINNNAKTVTNISANTTINVVFEQIPPFTVSFVTGTGNTAQADIAEGSSQAGITLPSGPSTIKCAADGWTFAGWSATNIASETTTAPTILDAGAKYYPTEDCTLYAVYRRSETGTPTEQSIRTIGFESSESFTATNTYNSSTTTTGGSSPAWSINYGAFTTASGAAQSGSQAAQFRIYNGTGGGFGELKTTGSFANVTKFTFYAKTANATDTKLTTYYSTNGSTWTALTSDRTLTTSHSKYTENINASGVNTVYIKFSPVGSTRPSSGNYAISIDNIEVFGMVSSTTTYYLSSPDCCTELAQIKGSVSLSQLDTPDPKRLKASWSWGDNPDMTGIDHSIIKIYNASNDGLAHTSGNIANNVTTYEVPANALTPCTEYYATITTIKDNNATTYCDGVEHGKSVTNVSTIGYTYTNSSTHVNLVADLPASTCANGGADVDIQFTAAAGYRLPTTDEEIEANVSVTNAGEKDEDWFCSVANNVLTISLSPSKATGTIDIKVDGIVTIVPEITVSTNEIDFDEVKKGAPTSTTFTVEGAHLSNNITLSSDEEAFMLSSYSLTQEGGSVELTTITLTANTTTAGDYAGTITISDGNDGATDKTIDVYLTVLETYTVNWFVNGTKVHEQTDVANTDYDEVPSDFSAFTDCEDLTFVGWKEGAIDGGSTISAPSLANIGSAISAANKDYYAVFAEGTPGGTNELLNETFTNERTSDNNTALTSLDNFTITGKVYEGAYSTIKFGSSNDRGSITSKELDLSDAFTVQLSAKQFGSDATVIYVRVGDDTRNISTTDSLTSEFKTFTFQFEGTEETTITIGESGKRGYIDDVVVTQKVAPIWTKWYTTCPHAYIVALSPATNGNGTISFAKNASAITEIETTGENDVTVDVVAAPATGYELTGVALSGIGGASYSAGVITLPANTEGTLTATATFSKANYAVTYTAPSNGTYTVKVGDAAAVSTNTTAQYEQTITLAVASVTEGYQFIGWTVTKTVGGEAIAVDGNNQFTMPAEAVTVAAIFQEIPAVAYTVTFNAGSNGALNCDACTESALEEESAGAGVTLPSCTAETGYAFLGWTATENKTTVDEGLTADALYRPEENITLYAVYKQLKAVTLMKRDNSGTDVVLYENVATGKVELPARTCKNNDYTFAGWSTTYYSTEQEDADAVIFATGEYTPMGNITLYPVFSRSSESYVWTKITDLSTVTEGTYALVSTDNYAFNGTISSGHGQKTATAFAFTEGVAEEAPDGTCILEFQAVTEEEVVVGYKMYNATYGYLYASAASSGKLAWKNSEESYWKEGSGDWLYNANSAHLRVYDNTFRTYSGSNNNALAMAKKTTVLHSLYLAAPANVVAAPTFDPVAGAYYGAQNVTISSETNDVTIYYTEDGSVPSNESTEFTGAFSVSSSKTIKAIAIDEDGYSSPVAEAAYTIYPVYNSIAAYQAANAQEAATARVIINKESANAIVIGVTGSYSYIQDGTAAMVIKRPNANDPWAVGSELDGYVQGTRSTYYGLPMITVADVENVATSEGTLPTVQAVNNLDFAGAWSSYAGNLIKVSNVYFQAQATSSDKVALQDGSANSGQLYDAIHFLGSANLPLTATACDVTGILVARTENEVTTHYIAPTALTDISTKGAVAQLNVSPVGGADAEHAVGIAPGGQVTVTPVEGFATTLNGEAIDAISTVDVTGPISITVSASRQFYTDNNQLYYYEVDESYMPVTVTQPANAGGSTISADKTSAQENDVVTLSRNVADHYHFNGWNVYKTGDAETTVTVTNNQFYMPAYAVTVEADIEEDAYATVVFDGGDATGTAPASEKKYVGQEVTMPNKGALVKADHVLASWTYNEAEYAVGDTYEIQADDAAIGGKEITFTANWTPYPWANGGDWMLVTDAAEVTAGSYVIIAAAASNVAISNTQNNNNRAQQSISKNDHRLTYTTAPAIFEVRAGNIENTLAFYDVVNEGYIYAAGGGKGNNHLKTETTLSNNSSWIIEDITSAGVAEVEAQGTNTNNKLQHNSSSSLFSCYNDYSQSSIALYKYYAPVPKVTYDKNTEDEVTNMPNPSVQRAENNKAVIAAGPSRTGYTFEGWKNGNTTYTVGEEYTFTEDITLYAQWAALPSFHVTYNTSGSQGTTPTDATDYYEGDEVTLASASGLSNAGYFFDQWVATYVDNNSETQTLVIEDGKFTMPAFNVTVTATWARKSSDKWIKVTATSQLAADKEYIIVNTDATYAVGAQGSNNRTAAAIEENNGILTISDAVAKFTLGIPEAGKYTFENGGKYLYASSDTKNYLHERAENSDANGIWTINIGEEGAATVTATGRNTRNIMRYNPNNGSPVFSCYASSSSVQNPVVLYYKAPKIEINDSESVNVSDAAGSDIVIHEGGILTVDASASIGDLTVEAGGQVVLDANKLTVVGTFTIETTMASGKSGQLNGATASNFEAQEDAYIDITLGDNGNPEKWHAFTVPFPVDAINGIYDLDGNKLVNEVNYAIMDYHGDIRATGNYGWKKFRGVLVPGTFYLMTVDGLRTTYRFKKTANGAIVAGNTKALYEYASSTGGNDNGWNGVGNPTLMYGQVAYKAQVLNPASYTYEAFNENETNFIVGTPFFIQATEDGTMTFAAASGSANYAPARQAAKEIKDVKVTFGNEEYTDKLYISASEDALNEYETGKDLAKMTMTSTPKVAQIFGKAYNTKLCMVYAPMANDQAVYDLTLYAPKAGEYTIAAPAMENADLYLTYEGAIIWDLSMGEYINEFAKGNNEGYGLLLQAKMPMTPTGVDEVQSDKGQCTKVIIDEHVYILRGGQMYDVTGKAVK